ncbi:FliH/SctL family protein [Massilia sp. S19_KUP03_FR1]|uniref:FliH/SctL family protein n=1 Tax=Massilia sp. S19_KUP03_FR1 TaxID=3025503 RepID=UPI002FCDBABF
MTSILRSPVMSAEKRTLGSPHAAPAALPATPVSAPTPAAPAKLAVPNMDALLAQARESVLAQFKQEAETARELGRQRGLQEGRAAGTEAARRDAEVELGRIRSISGKLHDAVGIQLGGLEDVAVAIAFEAVCRILGSTAATPGGIRALVREATARAAGAERVTVRLHPGDLAALQAAGSLDEKLASGTGVQWTADAAITLGGCMVDTDGGTLDARLDTQVDALRVALLAARGV